MEPECWWKWRPDGGWGSDIAYMAKKPVLDPSFRGLMLAGLWNESCPSISSDRSIIDRDVLAAASDELSALDSCENSHCVLLQSLSGSSRSGQRQNLRDPADVHLGELVDLGSDLRGEIVELRAHDAAQAHSIVVGQRGAKDLRISVPAPCWVA